jgi:hypothetical protein
VGEKKSSARLGRGLSTLLGDAPVVAAPPVGSSGADAPAPATTASGEGLLVLEVAQIRPNAAQPRRNGFARLRQFADQARYRTQQIPPRPSRETQAQQARKGHAAVCC